MVSAVVGGLGIGVSLYSGSKSRKDAKKSGKEAKRLAGLNAELIQKELDEKLRILGREQEKTRSTTRAAAASSGVTLTGSVSQYLSEQRQAQEDQIGFIEEAGKSRIDIVRQGGQAAKQEAYARGDAAFRQGITGAIGTASQTVVPFGVSKGWWT